MKYDVSGAFGEVRLYPSCVPTKRFQSVDHISHIGWHRVNDQYRIHRMQGHTDSLLLFTRSGHGDIQIGSQKYVAHSGTITLIPHDVYTAYSCAHDDIWEFNWLHYYGFHADSITADIVKQNTHLFNTTLQEIDLLFRPFTQNCTQEIYGELIESEALYHILQTLLKRAVGISHDPTENLLLKAFMQSVNEEHSSPFSLDAFAKNHHYSKEYVIRTVKKATGMSPYHYQKILTLKRSCDALATGTLSIGEIAAISGYQNTSSYSTEFKKYFGFSPSDYRKQYRIHQN